MKIDNQINLETPEGIDIQLTPAGIGVRTLSFIYDLLIRLVIMLAAGIALSFAGNMGIGLMLIAAFLVEWFYPVIFEITKGQTPGKKSFGLTVVYDNGLPVTLAGSLIRNLFRAVDFLPSFYLLGGICLLLSKHNKRVGDYIGGTMVVYNEAPLRMSYFNFEKQKNVELQLDPEMQKSIIAFAERSKTLSAQRQQELANILSPILNVQGPEAVSQLKSIAANLVGKA
ncbi:MULTISPECIES: RDD family protein [Aliiglaciecola]|uniref:RDD family protein n=1 Tax=Aliiglaciecola TaxID=1406885 RepID=UPI001C0993AD|nr:MULTISPECIES: RDD family protein [Aliiglaciecola]MBU2876048.1 RDD family protein [Aliiglaciecola lipolytica]MDO6713132.1 RDD family protein [Aliiglaciecola sp. 2_MG-2023]MDO6754194.1 RDD family protein [Aliiglaciecola sp. 1_MG-2023]